MGDGVFCEQLLGQRNTYHGARHHIHDSNDGPRHHVRRRHGDRADYLWARGSQCSRRQPDAHVRRPATVSYVTGTHNFQIGLDVQRGFRENYWWPLSSGVTNPIAYRTQGFVVNQVTIYAPPGRYRSNMNYNAGLFLQDRWKMGRLSLTGGLRFDLQKESYNPTTISPSQYVPNRPVQTISGANVVNWRDVNPRFGAAYDL